MTACHACRQVHPGPPCDGSSVKVQTTLPVWVLRYLNVGNVSKAVRDAVVRTVKENVA